MIKLEGNTLAMITSQQMREIMMKISSLDKTHNRPFCLSSGTMLLVDLKMTPHTHFIDKSISHITQHFYKT